MNDDGLNERPDGSFSSSGKAGESCILSIRSSMWSVIVFFPSVYEMLNISDGYNPL